MHLTSFFTIQHPFNESDRAFVQFRSYQELMGFPELSVPGFRISLKARDYVSTFCLTDNSTSNNTTPCSIQFKFFAKSRIQNPVSQAFKYSSAFFSWLNTFYTDGQRQQEMKYSFIVCVVLTYVLHRFEWKENTKNVNWLLVECDSTFGLRVLKAQWILFHPLPG